MNEKSAGRRVNETVWDSPFVGINKQESVQDRKLNREREIDDIYR